MLMLRRRGKASGGRSRGDSGEAGMSSKERKKGQHIATEDKPKSRTPGRAPGMRVQEAPSSLTKSVVKRLVSGRALWVSLALIAVSVFIYAPVRNHAFLAWDDTEYVSNNRHVMAGPTWNGIRWAFTTGHMANWHPLTWLSHMLDARLFGSDAGLHHCTNALFHILNALLLFALLQEMTGSLGRSAFVAALFAAHPLHVESVAWLSERKDVLSTFLALLALLAYVGYTRRPTWKRYLMVAVFFALGLMSKPMLVTLPFAMMLLDYWPLRRVTLEAGAAGKPLRAMARLTYEKLPLFALVLVSCIVTFIAQQRAGAVGGLDKIPLGLRASNALVSYAAYIGKTLWPAHLAALYPIFALAKAQVVGSGLMLAAISAGAILGARRWPYLPVGWLWYLGTLLPVIGLVQVGSQSMADRYTYIPSIGLFVIASWGAWDLLTRLPYRKTLVPAAAAIIIAACAITARAQVHHWKDSTTLWTHALTVNNRNDIAHNLLGEEFAKKGKLQEAIAQYTEALQINGNNAEANNNIGLALAETGKTAEALAHYQKALSLKPAFVDAHYNLAITLTNLGKIKEAIAEYSEALRLNREFVNAYVNLGVVMAQQGKPDEALRYFQEALRLQPNNASAHNNLGILLETQGKMQEAEAHFSEALRIEPTFEAARRNLDIIRSAQRTPSAAK